jgi:hypothetical protein
MAIPRNGLILADVAKVPDSLYEPIKTSIELPGSLWRAAKIRAMDDRVDLRTVMIRALETYLGMAPGKITRRGRPD